MPNCNLNKSNPCGRTCIAKNRTCKKYTGATLGGRQCTRGKSRPCGNTCLKASWKCNKAVNSGTARYKDEPDDQTYHDALEEEEDDQIYDDALEEEEEEERAIVPIPTRPDPPEEDGSFYDSEEDNESVPDLVEERADLMANLLEGLGR